MCNGTVTNWRYKSNVVKRREYTFRRGAMFGVVPKVLWSRKYKHNDTNHIYLRTDPLLLQTKDGNMLIDSGIGNGKLNEKMKRNQGVTEESSVYESLEN